MSFSFFMQFLVLTSELFMMFVAGLASFMVSEFLISLTFLELCYLRDVL